MSRTLNRPFITLDLQSPDGGSSPIDKNRTKKGILHFLPACLLVVLILAPHPSWLFVLVNYHLLILREPFTFGAHLLATYTLTFLALSSLIVCIARDPGPTVTRCDAEADSEEVGLTEALVAPEANATTPEKWCRKCWAPKPERAHHCETCERCVLKMDHHCPWLASKCVGHRTYPAFLHFLCAITLLAAYIAIISTRAFWFAFNNSLSIDEVTPVHELFLAFAGILFSMIVGSFLLYHVYLVSTNQTTLENLSPFLLLREIPPLPASTETHHLSDPPSEHELSYDQRSLVRHAHGHIRLYDIGWRKNWAQVFGWDKKWGWVWRILLGGGGKGDGRTFPRNVESDELLARLAEEIVKLEKDR